MVVPHLCAVLLCACVSPSFIFVYHSVTMLLSLSSIVKLEPKSIFVFLLLQHMYVILTCFLPVFFFFFFLFGASRTLHSHRGARSYAHAQTSTCGERSTAVCWLRPCTERSQLVCIWICTLPPACVTIWRQQLQCARLRLVRRA